MQNNVSTAKTSLNKYNNRSRASVTGREEFELPPGVSSNRVSVLIEEYDRIYTRSKEAITERKERKCNEFFESSPYPADVKDLKEDVDIQNEFYTSKKLTEEAVSCYTAETVSSDKKTSPNVSIDRIGKTSSTTQDQSPTINYNHEGDILSNLQNQVKLDKLDSFTEPKTSDEILPHNDKTQIGNSKNSRLSEWSHQAQYEKVSEQKDDETDWQIMPSYAPYDIYDDDNRLIAVEKHDSDSDDFGHTAGHGYTRVQMDDDVQSATSLDENTQYLFKDVNGTGAGEMEDEEQRDAISQLQATKDLLTEGQRIAYVGMVRLIISTMIRQSESIALKGDSKKETNTAAEAMKIWGQKMMLRLYAHMEISSAEQIMIEQLSEHGVTPSDLTATLMQNSRVKNPMLSAEISTSEQEFESSSRHSNNSISPSVTTSGPHEESASAPPPYEERKGEDLPEVRIPSQLPKVVNLDIDLRWTVLCDLFLTLVADSTYDARSRTLLEKVGKNVGIDDLEICKFEKRVTDALEIQQQCEKENWNENELKEARRKMALKKRYVMMGLATVGGSLVIGLSAGLLAPVIGAGLAAGFTTIGVTGTGGFLAGAGGAAVITSGAAASGGIIAVRAANRRTGAVKTFEYRPLHNNRRVNLIVTISGWMTGKVDDVRLPYSNVDPIMGDIYSVLWEPEMLRSMGDTINILATEALTQGLQQVLGSTILISLMAALQLPVVLTKLAYLIDNPWTVSLDRANSAGLILADSIIDRSLGTRPITLVGYSLGSRVIFSCLRELSKKAGYGLIQNVYLFGSPVVAKTDEYLKARSVVAGRFVNGYATNDWILGYLFRLTSGGLSRVAGLAPVDGVPDIENIDVTEFVPGHMSYRTAMPRLLRHVGWKVESDDFAEIEDPDPDNHQERQRELINEIEEARKNLEKEKEKESKGKFAFFSKNKKTKKRADWETYEESKKESRGSSSLVEDEYGNNHGVLFDIEAIRAELASEQMEVRELKSTLPPMRLNLDFANNSQSKLTNSQDLNGQILQKSASASKISMTFEPSQDNNILSSSSNHADQIPSPYCDRQQKDACILPLEKCHKPLKIIPNLSPSPQSLPKLSKAQLTSKSSSPPNNPSRIFETSPPDLVHNVWADDDDEFKEKGEVQMTFA